MASQNNPRGDGAVKISIALSVVGNLFVLMRLYARFVVVTKPGFEDLCLAVAMGFATAFTVLMKPFLFSVLCYYLALAFVKATFLFQYHRIFAVAEPRMRSIIYLAGVFVFLYSLMTVLVTVFLCVPVEKIWRPDVPGVCLNRMAVWCTNAALNIVTDFVIILLPMPALKQLRLPKYQKRAVILVFAVGGLTCAVSIARLQSLVKVAGSNDITYENASTATWSAGELNMALICASLPGLRPLLARVRRGLLGVSSRSTTGDDHSQPSRARGWPLGPVDRFVDENLRPKPNAMSDDELPLQSRCWARARLAEHGSAENFGKMKNGQIMVLTDISQEESSRR
ncbi:hypothetical protein MRS44_003976 [Fusarium solani]|uniref:uncharacterized protein n=1 Tax=Fusarium solani TaxID=169388 RepID=UPI0032C49F07|nr:hypothetical protein MRS44_003976 [Fusarium solani]